MKTVYLFVNGILNCPGSAKNWTGRAVTHTMTQTEHRAEKVEYLSFATFHRVFGQKRRARKMARTLQYYSGWDIHIACHSNGSDVVLDGLRYLDFPQIQTLHLFSPACHHDFTKIGLRQAQEAKRVLDVRVYIGEKDLPLRLADNFIGRLFGYGSLGLSGPVNHLEAATTVIRRGEWGHSDWWCDYNFPWTMNQILRKQN